MIPQTPPDYNHPDSPNKWRQQTNTTQPQQHPTQSEAESSHNNYKPGNESPHDSESDKSSPVETEEDTPCVPSSYDQTSTFQPNSENQTTNRVRQGRGKQPELEENTSLSDSPSPLSNTKKFLTILVIVLAVAVVALSTSVSNTELSSWRDQVSDATIRAALRPLLDPINPPGVSTLLLISNKEQQAFTSSMGHCIIELLNSQSPSKKFVVKNVEVNIETLNGTKLQLDENIKQILGTSDGIILRNIDRMSKDELNVLFAYCDQENPVITKKLILMTAILPESQLQHSEHHLKQSFLLKKSVNEDFVDGLMSRITANTLVVYDSETERINEK
ncbi:unnamed protein product [Didymodactylos carnosus]|uniref:Uncharacterized protein n=1 Tax=Didymodactylos carnosus TaxID=1234261 RepID=A0A8S2DXU0_9BILA|nr:unnamed protein product [Didymodactylos carnosus]CAF3804319.1 unnamed protein product [Didymodactylos carnosus]